MNRERERIREGDNERDIEKERDKIILYYTGIKI